MQRILRLPEVSARTGLSRSSLYLRINAGDFPAPITLGAGGRAVGFIEAEIDQWILDQAERRRVPTKAA